MEALAEKGGKRQILKAEKAEKGRKFEGRKRLHAERGKCKRQKKAEKGVSGKGGKRLHAEFSIQKLHNFCAKAPIG